MAALTDPGAVARPTDWLDRAACRDEDPELFYANLGVNTGPAKRVCASCPVRRTCLLKALEADDTDWGIRGGLAPKQRVSARRRLLAGDLSALDMPAPPPPVADLLADVRGLDRARLRRQLRRSGACQLWTGRIDNRGAGRFTLNVAGREVRVPAHRLAFAAAHDRLPVGAVRQTCGERRCCEPAHLVDDAMRADTGKVAA
jgi:WhiB family redox-sensing transcriptional regulator